jgi:hypothetical protein
MQVRGASIGQAEQVRDMISRKLAHVASLMSEVSQLSEGAGSDWYNEQFGFFARMSADIRRARLVFDEAEGGVIDFAPSYTEGK